MQLTYCVRYTDFRKQLETLNGGIQKKSKKPYEIYEHI